MIHLDHSGDLGGERGSVGINLTAGKVWEFFDWFGEWDLGRSQREHADEDRKWPDTKAGECQIRTLIMDIIVLDHCGQVKLMTTQFHEWKGGGCGYVYVIVRILYLPKVN